MLYRFDDFEVDTDAFELRSNGAACHVEPLVFDLICFFSKNAGRVLSRDEIVDHVWEGRVVSDATVSSCIKSARKALGDSGGRQTYIRTVRGRGFQFVADVLFDDKKHVEAAPTSAAGTRPYLPPSLAVLPFHFPKGNAQLASIADGLVGNFTTILTRVPLLSVASRSSTDALMGAAITADDVRQKLGVAYMLEGSVQPQGEMVCAHVQLIETHNGFHLWAQKFEQLQTPDCMVALLHDILPRLEAQIVRAVFNDLRAEDGELTGRQLLLQAMGLLSLKGWHKDTFREAAVLLRRSIENEPGLALTHAYLALILALGHRVGLLREDDTVVGEAIAEAETALEIDDMDSNVLGLAGCAFADVGQTQRGIPLLVNATDINPNNGQAWAALGSAYLIDGDTSAAAKCLKHGISISPMDSRLAVWGALLGLALMKQGDVDGALRAVEKACARNEKTYLPRVIRAAIRIVRDEDAAAKAAFDDCLRVKPDLSRQEIESLVGRKLAERLALL